RGPDVGVGRPGGRHRRAGPRGGRDPGRPSREAWRASPRLTPIRTPDLEVPMAFRINHIHLKAPDPRKTADWYVKAFHFKIVSDETRIFGDRFVRCMSEDGGMAVNISGARTGEKLGHGDAMPHHGLEHFGFDTVNLDADIARLAGLGCPVLEG